MSNKKDGSLDFRNVKNTQFDAAQTAKLEFSELQSSKRVYATNAVLKDAYTHFIQELDASSRPTKVTYYQATKPALDRVTVTADSNSNLSGKYFVLQEYLTQKTVAFYYVVDTVGSAPDVADIEIAVNISENDPAAVVALATKLAVESNSNFIVTKKQYLSGFFEVEYLQFGPTQAINLATSGFSVTRLQEGDSREVGKIELQYSSEGNPIWQGQELKDHIFDVYSAKFNVNSSSSGLTSICLTDNVNDSVTYFGESRNNDADTSDSVWRIKKVTLDTDGLDDRVEYADNGNFTQIWDNRAGLF